MGFNHFMCNLSISDLNAVIKRANSTEYGLCSGIFTKDISKALRFAEKIDAGTVFINTYNKTDVAAPFGGFKRSGFGKDLGTVILLFIFPFILLINIQIIHINIRQRSFK